MANNLNDTIIKKFEEYAKEANHDMNLAAHKWFLDWVCEQHPDTWECYLYEKNAHDAFFDEVFNKDFIDLFTFQHLPSKFQECVMKGV